MKYRQRWTAFARRRTFGVLWAKHRGMVESFKRWIGGAA